MICCGGVDRSANSKRRPPSCPATTLDLCRRITQNLNRAASGRADQSGLCNLRQSRCCSEARTAPKRVLRSRRCRRLSLFPAWDHIQGKARKVAHGDRNRATAPSWQHAVRSDLQRDRPLHARLHGPRTDESPHHDSRQRRRGDARTDADQGANKSSSPRAAEQTCSPCATNTKKRCGRRAARRSLSSPDAT